MSHTRQTWHFVRDERESQGEGWRKNKAPVTSPLSWLFCTTKIWFYMHPTNFSNNMTLCVPVQTTGIGKGRKLKKKNMNIGGEKMRNATCSSQQGENEWQWKEKVIKYDFSYTRCVTICRRFHVVHVVVQNNVKGMYKKSMLHVQSFFFC